MRNVSEELSSVETYIGRVPSKRTKFVSEELSSVETGVSEAIAESSTLFQKNLVVWKH